MIFLPFLFAWPHLNCTCLLNIQLNPLSVYVPKNQTKYKLNEIIPLGVFGLK